MPTNQRDHLRFKAIEAKFRTSLTPGAPAVIRLDGRAFHTYCRGLDRPYDEQFMADMDQTMVTLAEQIDGVRLAYVQSDEISLLLADHELRPGRLVAEQGFMFGGAVQKLVSIAAAIASVTFNRLRPSTDFERVALFDARAFSLADQDEARDYFVWRQDDARKNSLSMLASAHYSHQRLKGLSSDARAELLRSDGIEPDELPAGFRNGRIVAREVRERETTFFDRRIQAERTVAFERRVPVVVPAPDFRAGLPTS